MYLQWSNIDVGYPDFREANRVLWIHWEACKADNRSFGQTYLKIRRSGFSFMSSSECVNIGTLARDSRIGILSKTGPDAKKMFTNKVVPISYKLPFFFNPSWMVWINLRLSLLLESLRLRLPRKTCTPQRWKSWMD